MIWLRCGAILTGAVFFFVTLGYHLYARRQNQRAITGGPIYKADEREKIVCGICLKNMTQSEAVFLPCQHTFCSKCLAPLLNGTQTSCCICRMEITPEDLSILKLKLHKQE